MAKKVKRKEKSEEEQSIEQESTETTEETPNKTKSPKNKRKQVSFTEETIDNSTDTDPPKKKSKKQKSKKENVVIKAGIPTEEEMIECDKPENKSAKVSKRQKKKQKYIELLEKQKIESQINSTKKNLNYLSLWKHDRSQWKFEKLKQSWLQKNMFDDKLIPDDHWKTLVEYFSGAKGHIRQVILKECMAIVEKYEQLNAEEENQTEISETKFERARDMLQSLEE